MRDTTIPKPEIHSTWRNLDVFFIRGASVPDLVVSLEAHPVYPLNGKVLLWHDVTDLKAFRVSQQGTYTCKLVPTSERDLSVSVLKMQAALSQKADGPRLTRVDTLSYNPVYLLDGADTFEELKAYVLALFRDQRTDKDRENKDTLTVLPVPGKGFYSVEESIETFHVALEPIPLEEVPRYDVFEMHAFFRLTPPVVFGQRDVARRDVNQCFVLTNEENPDRIVWAWKQKRHEEIKPTAFLTLQNKLFWVSMDGSTMRLQPVADANMVSGFVDLGAYAYAHAALLAEIATLQGKTN